MAVKKPTDVSIEDPNIRDKEHGGIGDPNIRPEAIGDPEIRQTKKNHGVMARIKGLWRRQPAD